MDAHSASGEGSAENTSHEEQKQPRHRVVFAQQDSHRRQADPTHNDEASSSSDGTISDESVSEEHQDNGHRVPLEHLSRRHTGGVAVVQSAPAAAPPEARTMNTEDKHLNTRSSRRRDLDGDEDNQQDATRERVPSDDRRHHQQRSHITDMAAAPSGMAAPITMQQRREIVVCCGTGRIGSKVVEALARSGAFRVSVLTRNPTSARAAAVERFGARIIKADMMKMEDLRDAFRGVYGVFSMQPKMKDEVRMGKNVLVAAIQSQVEKFVYLSMIGASSKAPERAGRHKAALEDFTKQQKGKINYTIIRSAQLMDDYDIGAKYEPKTGKLGGHVDQKALVPYIALDDLAAYVSVIFSDTSNTYDDAVFPALGDKVDMNTIASVLTTVTGSKVKANKKSMLRDRMRSNKDIFLRFVAKEAKGHHNAPLGGASNFQQWAERHYSNEWNPVESRFKVPDVMSRFKKATSAK